MGTINLGPPVGENSRFELEVRLDPDNGCRIVPPQRVGLGNRNGRKKLGKGWGRESKSGAESVGRGIAISRGGRFVEADISGFRRSRIEV